VTGFIPFILTATKNGPLATSWVYSCVFGRLPSSLWFGRLVYRRKQSNRRICLNGSSGVVRIVSLISCLNDGVYSGWSP